jgi:hypothetical protein
MTVANADGADYSDSQAPTRISWISRMRDPGSTRRAWRPRAAGKSGGTRETSDARAENEKMDGHSFFGCRHSRHQRRVASRCARLVDSRSRMNPRRRHPYPWNLRHPRFEFHLRHRRHLRFEFFHPRNLRNPCWPLSDNRCFLDYNRWRRCEDARLHAEGERPRRTCRVA